MAKPSTATLKRRDPSDVERSLVACLTDRFGTGGAPTIARLELPSGPASRTRRICSTRSTRPGRDEPVRSESFVLQAAPDR